MARTVPTRALWFVREVRGETWRVYLSDPGSAKRADAPGDDEIIEGRTLLAGCCLYDTREILISADEPASTWRATLIHELTHAAARYLDERTVRAVERHVAPALGAHFRPPRLPPEAVRLARRVRARQRREEHE